MEEQELLKRAEDLSVRSVRKWEITHTAFLTPAEQMLLQKRFRPKQGCDMSFTGGYEEAERRIAVFRPEDCPEPECGELIHAVHYKAYFGEPGHRDYLGALLASGISRDRLGDILIQGEDAWVFCQPGIAGHLSEIDRIGRVSVRAEEDRQKACRAQSGRQNHSTLPSRACVLTQWQRACSGSPAASVPTASVKACSA